MSKTTQHAPGAPAITKKTRIRLQTTAQQIDNAESPSVIASMLRVEIRRITFEYNLETK